MDQKKQLSLTLFAFIVSAALVAALNSPLRNSAWVISDLWQNWFPAKNPQGVAAIILDQPSLNYLDESDGFVYPFPREIYGAMMLVAQHLEAKAVAFDFIFTETSVHGPDDDAAFAELVEASNIPTFFPAQDPTGSIKDPVEALKNVSTGLGAVHVPREADNNLRRVPSTLPGAGGVDVNSLAESVYQNITGKPSGITSDSLVHFYTVKDIPKVSFHQIVRAFRLIEEGQELPAEFDALKNKAWVFGVSAPGLHDFKATPLGSKTPGVYLHIMGLANRFSGHTIRTASGAVFWLVFIALLAAVSLVVLRNANPRNAIGIATTLAFGGSFSLSVLFWTGFSFWLNPLSLLLGAFLTGGSLFAIRFQTEWKERQKLAKSVEHSMSSNMVQLIKEGKVKIDRFGERRTVTILFSDLAGFTTLSEKLPADVLVKVLNTYFDEVVELIFKHDGYVDKFIGDAVMALWGAPINQDDPNDDIRNALKTAQLFERAVAKANDIAKEYDSTAELQARVGLHTGEVIVGNIGSAKRHNYTAIGDAVNLAARLESLSKQYDCLNLISAETAEAVENTENLVEVDRVQVKGKSEPTVIYSFIEDEGAGQKPTYQEALGEYRQANWEKAEKLFSSCSDLPFAAPMAARCKKAISEGSSPSFQNGTWVFDSK